MKLLKFLKISIIIICALSTHSTIVKGNPIENRGIMTLVHEYVEIHVDTTHSTVSGDYTFKKRNADVVPDQINFNLMLPIYKLADSEHEITNNLSISYDNKTLQTKSSDPPSLLGKLLSKHCPVNLRVQWYKTDNVIIKNKNEFTLSPFKISYKQINYKVDNNYYTIYTPLYKKGSSWRDRTYKVKVEPETFTIRFIPKNNRKLEIISEHSKYFTQDGNDLVINFKKYVDQPQRSVFEKLLDKFRQKPERIKSESWDLFIKAKPIIIKIKNENTPH